MDSEVSFNQSKYESRNPFKRMALDFFYQALVEMPFEAKTVLDAGCGEGFGANRLLDKFPGIDMIGTDLSWSALVAAKEISSDLETFQADVTRLPFAENQFDMIVSLEVLEHLPEPEKAVQAYQRTTARYLLLSVPNEPVFRTMRMLEGSDILQWGDHPEHVNHWNFISFARFLKKQGLRVITWKVPFPFTWVIVLCELVPEESGN